MSKKLTNTFRDALLLTMAAALCIQLKPKTIFTKKNIAEQLETMIEKAYRELEANADKSSDTKQQPLTIHYSHD